MAETERSGIGWESYLVIAVDIRHGSGGGAFCVNGGVGKGSTIIGQHEAADGFLGADAGAKEAQKAK